VRAARRLARAAAGGGVLAPDGPVAPPDGGRARARIRCLRAAVTNMDESIDPVQPVESNHRWIEGVIVGRRVLGKHLAFVTLQLSAGAPAARAPEDAENEIQRRQKVPLGNEEDAAALVKVQFRRQAPGAGAALPDGPVASAPKPAAQAIVWEGTEPHRINDAVETLRSTEPEHEQYDPAPFPQRRSQLQLGTKVAVKVCPQVVEGQPPLAVMRWRVIAHVGEECPSSVSALGFGAGAPAGAGGPFSVADRQRARQLAHSDALAVQARGGASVETGDSPARAPLCKYWMSTGVCEAQRCGKCGGYRRFAFIFANCMC
jgi:hypothetical protein